MKINTGIAVKLYTGGVSGKNIAKYFKVTTRIVYLRLQGTELRRTRVVGDQVELIQRILHG